MAAALIATFAASIAYGVGAVLQALGARHAAGCDEGTEGAMGLLRILRQPASLIGLLLDFFAWVASRIALHQLPLFMVNTVLAGSLAVTVAMSPRLLGVRIHRLDLVAILMSGVGLALVGFAADAHTAESPGRAFRILMIVLIPVLFFVGRWALDHETPAVTGAIAGLAFGASALTARSIRHVSGFLNLLGHPAAWEVVFYAVVGIVLFTRAVERGRVAAVTAAMWAAEIVPASIIGYVLLGDRVRKGWEVAALAGMALTLAATLMLARTVSIPVSESAHHEPERT